MGAEAAAAEASSDAAFSVSNCFGISPATDSSSAAVVVVVNYSCWLYELAKRAEELDPNCNCSRQKEIHREGEREREKEFCFVSFLKNVVANKHVVVAAVVIAHVAAVGCIKNMTCLEMSRIVFVFFYRHAKNLCARKLI